MEPIASLPVFFKLGGKRAVLAGGTAPAVWKAELLSAAGARVDVYAAEPCAELVALAAAPPDGPITLVARDWEPDDLVGAAIAIGAIEDAGEATRFREAAHGCGVPVNVIDNPPFCDFQFGTIVSRSPLVIGISTDGAAPVFGQALRARIEALLPQGLKAWAEAARDWRPAVQALGLDFKRRRRFWEAFTDLALAAPDRPPDGGDLDQCRRAIETPVTAESRAELVLVGSGPGDPDSLTLHAIRALQSADVVLSAPDLSPLLVGFARRESVKASWPAGADDDTLVDLLSRHLAPGRRVVWLDKGDPDLCMVWQKRAALARPLGPFIAEIAGLGRCDACAPGCPAWPLG